MTTENKKEKKLGHWDGFFVPSSKVTIIRTRREESEVMFFEPRSPRPSTEKVQEAKAKESHWYDCLVCSK